MKIKPLRQKHDSGCGPTSIKIIADYFEITISMKKVEELCGAWKEDGMGNQDLVNTLKKIGFRVRASHNFAWEDLIAQNTDDKVIVVSWMLKGHISHFSIVEKVNNKHIWLAEPESGEIIKLERIIFMRLWLDYDDLWYPEKSSDIKLRWMAIVSKNNSPAKKKGG